MFSREELDTVVEYFEDLKFNCVDRVFPFYARETVFEQPFTYDPEETPVSLFEKVVLRNDGCVGTFHFCPIFLENIRHPKRIWRWSHERDDGEGLFNLEALEAISIYSRRFGLGNRKAMDVLLLELASLGWNTHIKQNKIILTHNEINIWKEITHTFDFIIPIIRKDNDVK